MERMNKKQVKIQGKFRASRSRGIMANSLNKTVPWLNVNGVWLEKLGFRVGDRVNITSSAGKLIIERLEGVEIGC